MKIVKPMLMHLGTLKNLIFVVHIVIHLLYTRDPNLCMQHIKLLRSHNSLFLTKRLVSLIARIPQNCSNVLTTPKQSLTQLYIGNTNISNILAHISVAKAT